MQFADGKEKFDIVEVEVFDEEDDASLATGYDAEAPVRVPREEQRTDRVTQTREEMRQRRRDRQRRKDPKVKKYNWAFFLASMFVGLAITTVTEAPVGLFIGMGLGFLFFVDPIYEKVMEKIDRL